MNSRKNFRKSSVAGAALLAIVLVPAGAAQAKPAKQKKSATVTGTVVHNNEAAHSFVVAEHSGRLDAVHGPRERVGKKVRVEARKLANGTFAQKKVTAVKGAKASKLKIHGVVSSDDAANHEIVISGVGSSFSVSDDPATTTGDDSPAIGETIDATVEVEGDGRLKADDVTALGQSQAFRVEGKVLAIDEQARKLTITADDDGTSDQTVDVTLPDSFDLTAFHVGDCVELTVSKAADGSFLAVQSFGDDNAREADNGGHHGRGRGGPSGDRSDHNQSDDSSSGQTGSDHSGSGSSDSGSEPDGSGTETSHSGSDAPATGTTTGSTPQGSDDSGSGSHHS